MDRVTLQNYRCFREEQSARLAPLTFLVGENSTGKTSFLALLRALWQVAFHDRIPDFRQPPYDLGSFEDVVHIRGANNKLLTRFKTGFESALSTDLNDRISYRVTFEDREGYAFPSSRIFSKEEAWLEIDDTEPVKSVVRHGEGRNVYEPIHEIYPRPATHEMLFPLATALSDVWSDTKREVREKSDKDRCAELSGQESSIDKLRGGLFSFVPHRFGLYEEVFQRTPHPPFASAPIRSRPRRTYDPSRPTQDPEGEYIPDYFASMSRNEPEDWERLKSNLEDFGRDSGLFDEIAVLSFGKTAGAPFQIQIRKFGKMLKGPRRNLIDVGYGVSQALPILTELLREDSPRMFLLQQPEVHLHPRAQAALGSLFCNLAASGKQIIVETHSDYILDRARMNIRDGNTALKPEDISILYFERDELDANIHSLGIDEEGNVLDAPPGYGQFFMDEMRRSVGL